MEYQSNFPFVKLHFARRLKELRDTRGLKRGKVFTQEEIAKLVGVSRRVYIDWENPTKEDAYPRDIHVWIALCEILETDLIFLSTGLFDGQKERKHQDEYVNIYSRYIGDEHFNYAIKLMMRWNSRTVKGIADHFEAITDFYEGGPPIE